MCFRKNKEKIYKEVHITDTVFTVKTDTIIVNSPKYISKHKIDTVYIRTKGLDSIVIPIEQKHYSLKSVYDVWASGYKVGIDSIKVYPKMKIIHITDTKEKIVDEKRHELYVFGGLQALQGDFIPKVGISWKTEKDWVISADMGLYKEKPTYGINIGKRIK